jgi:hypothetical protein
MRRFVAAMILLAGILPAAESAEAVREAADGWTQSAVKQDKAGLERWLADDLQYSHANGRTQTKAEYIAAVTSGPARYEAFIFSEVKVRFYGKAAVLTGFVDVKMVGAESFRVRTLQVYVENGGHWQMAAHQSARLGR